MQMVVDRERILPVLTRGAAVVEKRQTLPILANFLIRAEEGRFEVVSTDLEMEVRGECEAQVTEVGETTVPARKLLDIVRNLPERAEIRLKVFGERCTLVSGRGRFTLGTLSAADFPLMQAESDGLILEVEEGGFRRLLEKTWFAMAQQDVRYYLNGLLLEFHRDGIRAVATDGHRLSMFDLDSALGLGEERRSVIVPYKAVMELRRLFGFVAKPVRIVIGDRTIRFEAGEYVTVSKLIDGRFPDYGHVIGVDHPCRAVLDKDRLRGALVRTSVLSNEKYKGVRMEFEKDVVRLQAHNPEQEEGVEEVDATLEGEGATLGFNVAYLSDVLGAAEGSVVEVRFNDGDSSSVWRGEGAENETFVVMPMRL